MKNRVFRLYFKGWRLVLANCPVKVKKFSNSFSTKNKRCVLKGKTLESQDSRCKVCGKTLTYHDSQLHHIVPIAVNNKMVEEESNLMCLCEGCHREIHANPFLNVRMIARYFPMYLDMYGIKCEQELRCKNGVHSVCVNS